jgi:UDP-N-acetylmuramate--alanine ligase
VVEFEREHPVRFSSGAGAGTVHFIGISGIGMSALARILLQRGYHVTGSSDRRTALTERLALEGASVTIGHKFANVGDAATVVISTAIALDNPELVAAKARHIEVVHRGALLAHMMSDRRGIAIAGTHGKTTTTAMVAATLEAGGLDPSVIVGGERIDTQTNARDGKGAWLVSEADESDLSFLNLRPEIAVVSNIENDHIASDAELPRLVAAFERFTANVPAHGLALIGIDEPRSALLAGRERSAKTRTYGFDAAADVRAVNARYAGFGSRFGLDVDGRRAGEIELSVPGAINVFDALPSVAIGLHLGVPFATIAAALASFRGVRRRFEFLARTPRMTLVDDYAHHPTAVAATIAAARENFAGPIFVAFQPHRYTRTQYLAADFARALRGADHVVLTDVYGASEPVLPGVDATAIGAPLAALGADVAYVSKIEDLPAYIYEHAPAGALVLALGAGSITGAAAKLALMLEPSGAVAS